MEIQGENHPDTLVVGIYGEEGKNDDIPLLESNGVTFAILNYTYGANSEILQRDLENHTNILSTYNDSRYLDYNSLNPQVLDDISRANELADIVIVCPHWGTEYATQPSSYQKKFAMQMTEAGADVIDTAISCFSGGTAQPATEIMKYVCDACGWEYDEAVGDPENGIAPGTKFEELPDDFECPLCRVGKDMFSKEE